MADVFISYASEDRATAQMLAIALRQLGWSVWWDREIIAGEAFDSAIERELESAKSVVVLWSANSTPSEWVKNEAAAAAERGVLVPALIDSVKIPLEFRRKQTVDLTTWEGEPSQAGFQSLCRGIASLMEGGSQPAYPAPPLPPDKKRWRWIGLSGAVIAIAATVYLIMPWKTLLPGAPGNKPQSMQNTDAGPADIAAGEYRGDVIADARGSSRSDINVRIVKIDSSTIRVTSAYDRIGAVDIALTRIDGKIYNAGGDSIFILDPRSNPPSLSLNVHNEVSFLGALKQ